MSEPDCLEKQETEEKSRSKASLAHYHGKLLFQLFIRTVTSPFELLFTLGLSGLRFLQKMFNFPIFRMVYYFPLSVEI